MSKYIICQSFKKFHRAVFSIAHPSFYILSTYGGIFLQRMEAAIVCTDLNLQRMRLATSIDIFA
jgi:hypothetical protein